MSLSRIFFRLFTLIFILVVPFFILRSAFYSSMAYFEYRDHTTVVDAPVKETGESVGWLNGKKHLTLYFVVTLPTPISGDETFNCSGACPEKGDLVKIKMWKPGYTPSYAREYFATRNLGEVGFEWRELLIRIFISAIFVLIGVVFFVVLQGQIG